ncbi:MAG: Transcriptional regulator [Candidatus Sulfotelmatobacter sp.]|nr:Transcriptional regulator [Candidatus Sulfotelmatobacter sp.]
MGAFGEKLRKQREQRGLALDAISNSTKISTRMLRALEDEHFDQLPGGVFNKGFVRAYARQVGLDEDETVTDYLTALRESQVQSQQILPDFRAPGGKPRAITNPDVRHHVLPAGDHPVQDNGHHDLPAAERRKQERRNEVRRHKDRDGRKSEVQKSDDHGVDHLVDHSKEAAFTETSRMPIARVTDSRRQDAPQPRGKDEGKSDRGDHRALTNSSGQSGFITMGPGAENSAEPAEERSPRIFSPRILKIVAPAAILLLTLGVAIWNSRRHREPSVAAPSNSSPQLVVAQATAPVMTPASASSPKTEQGSAAAKPTGGKSSAVAQTASIRPSVTSLPAKPAANPSVGDPPVEKTINHPLTEKAPATFTLLIRAEQTTWISIVADGKPVTHETLIAPAHTSVRATRDVIVKAGNAAGISFLLNGKEFPAQGNEGEVKTYLFDATGLRPLQ